jgi:hypothetical protein
LSYTETFDGSLSLPSGWTWGTGYSVTNSPPGGITPISGANVLEVAATGGFTTAVATYGTQATADSPISCYFNADGLTSTVQWGVFARCSGTDFSAGGSSLWARFNPTAGTLRADSGAFASPTLLQQITGIAATAPNWYLLTLTPTGTSLAVQLRRGSDGFYLNSSSVWQSSSATAISVTGVSVTGAGYPGLTIQSRSNNSVADNFTVGTLLLGATMGVTEGHDTPSVAGASRSSGHIAATEHRDTASIAGTCQAGTAAATEHHDTASVAASFKSPGAVAATEHRDAASAAGAFKSSGSIAATEHRDTPAASGTYQHAAIAAAEARDSASAHGSFRSSGHIAAAEGHDAASIAGLIGSSGSIAATEHRDAASASGVSARGAIAATEHHDAASVSGVTVHAAIAATEHHDTASVGVNTPNAILTRLEGPDTPSFAGAFGSPGTIAATEAHDSPIFFAASPYAGVLAATEHHDTPSIAASCQLSATLAIVEHPDTPAIVGLVRPYAALAIAEAGDRAAIPAVAAGIPPYFKVKEQPDVPAFPGHYGTTWYLVYASPSAGQPIDYTTPIAMTAGTTWTSSVLAVPGTWGLAVRAENTNGIEQNIDCAVYVTLDADGNDITNTPLAPVGLRAVPLKGGRYRVLWTASPAPAARAATSFNIYVGTGGTPNYAVPSATVQANTAIMGSYSYVLNGSDGATYTVGVRARNRTGEEKNTATVTVTADSAGPSPVLSLSSTTIT